MDIVLFFMVAGLFVGLIAGAAPGKRQMHRRHARRYDIDYRNIRDDRDER